MAETPDLLATARVQAPHAIGAAASKWLHSHSLAPQENYATQHCWWEANFDATGLSVGAAQDNVRSLARSMSLPDAFCDSLTSAHTGKEQIAFAVQALAAWYPNGLVMLHAQEPAAWIFRPDGLTVYQALPVASEWLRSHEGVHVMLCTFSSDPMDVGHAVFCAPTQGAARTPRTYPCKAVQVEIVSRTCLWVCGPTISLSQGQAVLTPILLRYSAHQMKAGGRTRMQSVNQIPAEYLNSSQQKWAATKELLEKQARSTLTVLTMLQTMCCHSQLCPRRAVGSAPVETRCYLVRVPRSLWWRHLPQLTPVPALACM